MCPRATWLAPSTGYTPRSTLRPPPVITRPCGRCAWWRGLKTTVAVNPDCSSAPRMAWPAASLTPSGSPLPRNPAHASAAASVACTRSNGSSRCASKEGIPLLCCSISVLGCLGFFQQPRGTKLHLVDPALQERRPHEIAEQRVRTVRARAELRVELARDKPRVVGQLDDLDQASVGREPAEHHAPLAHHLTIFVVELEAMAVALVHDLLSIGLVCVGTRQQLAWIEAKSHRTAHLVDVSLFGHEVDDRCRGERGELRRVGIRRLELLAREIDHRALHAETEAQIRNAVVPRVARGDDLAFDAAIAKTTRHDDACYAHQG